MGESSRLSGVVDFNKFRLKGLVRTVIREVCATMGGELASMRTGVGIATELQFIPKVIDSSRTR